MRKPRSWNRRAVLTRATLCTEYFDTVYPTFSSLSATIWVDNASVMRKRKKGIWFETEDGKCAFIDTDGNFYSRRSELKLSEEKRDELRSFVRLFRREIGMLSEKTLSLDEFRAMLLECRRLSTPFTLWKDFDRSILTSVRRRWCDGILKENESGLGVKVRLDTLSTYNLIERSDNIHYVEFRTGRSNCVTVCLDENLTAQGSTEKFGKRRTEGIRNFVQNNRSLISSLSDYPYTGVDTVFFRSHFIPGDERKEDEERKLEKTVTEYIAKWRKERGLPAEYDIYEAKKHMRPLS